MTIILNLMPTLDSLSPLKTPSSSTSSTWRVLWLALVSGTGFTIFEWLFQATKPSALSGQSWIDHALALVQPAALLSIVAALSVLPALLLRRANTAPARAALWTVSLAMPVVLFTVTTFLLLDNFTYTLAGFGVATSQGVWRAAYAALLLGLLVLSAWKALAFAVQPSCSKWMKTTAVSWLVSYLLIVGTSAAVLRETGAPAGDGGAAAHRSLSNILFIGSDAMLAEHMSAYGYARDTTPLIKEWMSDALVAENAFANSDKTHASVASLLTGKHPLRMGVFWQTQALQGEDAFQHVPALLRRLGYYNATFGVRHQGDPVILNLKDGFDVTVGSDPVRIAPLFDAARRMGLLTLTSESFARESALRASERVLHALGIMDAENPFLLVTRTNMRRLHNDQRHRSVLKFLEQTPEPFFLHAHYMGTHGPRFSLQQQRFSAGEVQTHDWMPDFYDDAIAEFDTRFGEVLAALRERGALDRTIVVVYADHGTRRIPTERVPLIIRFPHGEHRGRFASNAALVDATATVLDYIGVAQPSWHDGRSWLSAPGRTARDPIWAVKKAGGSTKGLEGGRPAGVLLGKVSALYCDRAYTLATATGKLRTARVASHTAPCKRASVPDANEARAALIGELERWGYAIPPEPQGNVRNP